MHIASVSQATALRIRLKDQTFETWERFMVQGMGFNSEGGRCEGPGSQVVLKCANHTEKHP